MYRCELQTAQRKKKEAPWRGKLNLLQFQSHDTAGGKGAMLLPFFRVLIAMRTAGLIGALDLNCPVFR